MSERAPHGQERPPAEWAALQPRLNRRQVLERATALGLSVSTVGALLAACGDAGDGATSKAAPGAGTPEPPAKVTGTAVIANYEGWMGKDTVKSFQTTNPGTKIKQVPGIEGNPQVIKADPDRYDMVLADLAAVGRLEAAGVLQELDWSRIPNIENVDPKFRETYDKGIPTDYGKIGLAYRTDLVDEDLKGWADVWRVAQKYSGQIVFDYLYQDVIGIALMSLGHPSNSADPAQLEAAKKALIDIKPHLQAFLKYDIGSGLVTGKYAIAMSWDYDIAAAQKKEPKIKWVTPEEGALAYLEGFVAVKDTPQLDLVQAFMNHMLDPKQYADFVNTTGSAYIMSAATPHVKPAIAKNPLLAPNPEVLAAVELEDFLGEATPLWTRVWEEVKSA